MLNIEVVCAAACDVCARENSSAVNYLIISSSEREEICSTCYCILSFFFIMQILVLEFDSVSISFCTAIKIVLNPVQLADVL